MNASTLYLVLAVFGFCTALSTNVRRADSARSSRRTGCSRG